MVELTKNQSGVKKVLISIESPEAFKLNSTLTEPFLSLLGFNLLKYKTWEESLNTTLFS
jgi:hypothetical protein